jgi:DNA-binding XRE family transcriptional regulator
MWRKRLGFTQQELVRAARVSIATIVLIERYGYLPRKSCRVRISAALGVKEDRIFPDLQKTAEDR